MAVMFSYARHPERGYVHVDEVDNGLACGCVCVKCGAQVLSRQGEHYAHHFAHVAETTCTGGVESELHLAKKLKVRNWLQASQNIRQDLLPYLPTCLNIREMTYYVGDFYSSKDNPLFAIMEQADNVELEYARDGYVFDVAATAKGYAVLGIEVIHTNYVSDEKLWRIRQAKDVCFTIMANSGQFNCISI